MTDYDGYAAYYSQRLWSMLPEVYRTDDASVDGTAGPLQELLNRIGGQVAVVRRSLDRLWADQSIETCDDWVIPYIGALLGTNLVSGLDARGQRLDVAKTIHYRRHKGTPAVLEELAIDVTGWSVHVVEGFRRLARSRHSLDPMVGAGGFPGQSPMQAVQLLQQEGLAGPLTGTPAGGLADLRSVHGAALAGAPFDESFHMADFRAGQGAVGHFAIPNLLVFLWRLMSLPVVAGTPVAVQGSDETKFTFDPTGRMVPLFLPPPGPEPDNFADTWTSAFEWQVPGPITSSLAAALANVLGSVAPPQAPYPFPPPVAAPFGYSISGADFDQVCPEVGVFTLVAPSPGPTPTVSYQYGFPGLIGAGPYDRLLLGNSPQTIGTPVQEVSGGAGLDTAIAAAGALGTVAISDSLTYAQLAPAGDSTAPISGLVVMAAYQSPPVRPVLRPPPGAGPWVFTGAEGAQLTLDGLFVSGCDVVLRGAFDTVRITACTMDPGTASSPDVAGGEGSPPRSSSSPPGASLSPPGALLSPPGGSSSPPAAGPLATSADGRALAPTTIWIEADPTAKAGSGGIAQLVIDHCVLGPVRTRFGGSVDTLSISDSIVQGIPTTSGAEYTPADVYDPSLLGGAVASLQADDAVADKLLAPLASALEDYTAPQPVPEAVIGALNSLVALTNLYDDDVFSSATLSPDVLAAAQGNPSLFDGGLEAFNRSVIDEAFPIALGVAAIAVNNVTLELTRVTVLGRVAVHRLQASDCILNDFTVVDDTQDGCIRFSAYSTGSRVPRQYESVAIEAGAPLFTSVDFGNPGYGQLLDGADGSIAANPNGGTITAGAGSGSEMGAFSSNLAPIKEQGILVKYAEYMPLGLTPVIVHVT
ncbi:MAG TPA: hypothetical protein VMF65_04560 [Acidimicrobiales bacterium]|nr:hypothetical protein [Acidimicrobiales bacterium]